MNTVQFKFSAILRQTTTMAMLSSLAIQLASIYQNQGNKLGGFGPKIIVEIQRVSD